MYLTTTAVQASEVLTWPQALVGAISIIVLSGVPQILTYLSNRSVKKQVNNNGGSSMKDAVDRIETKQDSHTSLLEDHIKEAAEKDTKVNERLVRVETIIEFALKKEGEINGPGL